MKEYFFIILIAALISLGVYFAFREKPVNHIEAMGYDKSKVEDFVEEKNYTIVEFAQDMKIREEYEKWLKGK